jgi:hypothetical protein
MLSNMLVRCQLFELSLMNGNSMSQVAASRSTLHRYIGTLGFTQSIIALWSSLTQTMSSRMFSPGLDRLPFQPQKKDVPF